MNRILILLASLLVAGCPQQTINRSTGDVWCADDNSVWWTSSSNIYTMSGQPPCGSWAKAFATKLAAQAYLDGASPKLIWCVDLKKRTFFSASASNCGDPHSFRKFDSKEEAEQFLGISEIPTPTPSPQPTPAPTPEPDYQLVSTGTGFVVNKFFVVTADHVLRKNERGDACDALSIVYRKDEYEAQGVDADPANDLGLIKLSKPIESTAKLRGQPDLIQGEMAVNYGFPLMGELSTSAKVTGGSVNSLSGYNNNSAFLQYDAASQHGNSGGPVLDASGNIIGVVSSKLDDAGTQLVNFATKSTILEGFLKSNNVAFEKEDLGEELRLSEIAKKAETFTVLVGCWE